MPCGLLNQTYKSYRSTDRLFQPGEQQMEQIHVVLYPFSAKGHTIPALVFAQRLLESGIRVKFFTLECRLPSLLNLCQVLGIQVDDERLTLVTLSGGDFPPEWSKTEHDVPESVKLMMRYCYDSQAEFQKSVLDMKTLAGSGSRWFIVSDLMFSWIQDVANELGIPRYVFYPSPASILAGVFYVKQLQAQGRLPFKASSETYVTIPGMPPIRTIEMHGLLLDAAPKSHHDIYVSICTRVHEAAGIFVNTFQEVEEVALEALQNNKLLNPNTVRIFPVGPLLPRAVLQKQITSQEDRSLLWLNSQRPRSVVYVSFGSIAVIPADQVEELAYGLAASEQKFIWILRQTDDERNVLPPGFPGEQGLVVSDWAPQLAILGHESTGAFVTHSGWNSTIESLSFGVPVLTAPSFSDQALNSKLLVEDLRVGLRMSSIGTGGLEKSSIRLLDRQEIVNAVREVMTNPRFRERARVLMVSARTAADRSSSAVTRAFEIQI